MGNLPSVPSWQAQYNEVVQALRSGRHKPFASSSSAASSIPIGGLGLASLGNSLGNSLSRKNSWKNSLSRKNSSNSLNSPSLTKAEHSAETLPTLSLASFARLRDRLKNEANSTNQSSEEEQQNVNNEDHENLGEGGRRFLGAGLDQEVRGVLVGTEGTSSAPHSRRGSNSGIVNSSSSQGISSGGLGLGGGNSGANTPPVAKKKKEFIDDLEAWERWRDVRNHTLLHVACATDGHQDIAQLLLELLPNLDPNSPGQLGETALHVACLKGLPLAVRTLLEHSNVNVAALDTFGATPLWYASVNGHQPVVEELLREGRGGRDLGFALPTNTSSAMPNLTALEAARTVQVKDLLEEFAEFLVAKKSVLPLANISHELESGYWTPPKSSSTLSRASSAENLSENGDGPRERRDLVVEFDYRVYNMSLTFPFPSIASLQDELAIQMGLPAVNSVQYLNPRLGVFQDLEHIHLLNTQTLISTLKVNAPTLRWWSWEVQEDSAWVSREEEHKRLYYSLVLKDGNTVKDEPGLEKLRTVLEGSNISLNQIKKAVAVHNPGLLAEFEAFREGLWSTKKGNFTHSKPTDSWFQKRDAPARQRYIDHLDKYAEQYGWNTGDQPSVLPVFFPTLESRVHQICQGGFAETEIHFGGQFGRGRYFTTTLFSEDALIRVAKMSHPGCNLQDDEVILLCFASPGKVFPVTEHPLGSGSLKGKPCIQGYNAHYTLSNRMDSIPITGPFNPQRDEDNLVLFSAVQVIPAFVLYL